MNENLIMDFNDITSRENDLIPAGTFVKVRMSIRSGGYGSDGILSKTKNTNTLYLNAMLIVTEGIYTLRKIYHCFPVQGPEGLQGPGGLQGPDLHDSWVEKGQRQLRLVLESAHHILPTDTSEEAKKLRKVQSYREFDGLTFLIKVGVENSKNPQYPPKNCVQSIVTPDWPEYSKEFLDPPQMDWPL